MHEIHQEYLEIVVPTVPYQDEAPAAGRSPRPASVRDRRVAFVANWKPVSLPFMESLADALQQRSHARTAYLGVPSWEFTHPDLVAAVDPEADAMAARHDLAVSGVAD